MKYGFKEGYGLGDCSDGGKYEGNWVSGIWNGYGYYKFN